MKTKFFKVFVSLGLAFALGCASMTAYKSLGATELTVSSAYTAYTDLVIQGKVPTNDVPRVSHAFNSFQAGMSAAVIAAQFNTNAPSNQTIQILAQNVTDAIAQAKLVK